MRADKAGWVRLIRPVTSLVAAITSSALSSSALSASSAHHITSSHLSPHPPCHPVRPFGLHFPSPPCVPAPSFSALTALCLGTARIASPQAALTVDSAGLHHDARRGGAPG